MEQYIIPILPKEYFEEYFEKILIEVESLKKQIQGNNKVAKFYRNKDLKKIFGFSDNTIREYREKGILPYTIMGEIYFYPVEELNFELARNANYKKL